MSTTLFDEYDKHTGNLYGCVCGWQNPVEVPDVSIDGLPGPPWSEAEMAQREHASRAAVAAWWTPDVTNAARLAVREVLPDLPGGKDATAAIAALSAALRPMLLPESPTGAYVIAGSTLITHDGNEEAEQ